MPDAAGFFYLMYIIDVLCVLFIAVVEVVNIDVATL